jgi:hypothetical protein
MRTSSASARLPRGDFAVYGLAAATLVLHLVANARDAMFRDEFYYLACADHLDWGYVDHPPLSILVLKLARALTGDSVWAVRLLPALAGAALVVVVARLARELGGSRFAATLAATCAAVAPHWLGTFGYYSMNAFDVLFWAAGAWVFVRIVHTDEPRRWLGFGLLCGFGLLNKVSMGFFGCGVAVALLATRSRWHLRTPWPWVGAALALLVFAPHVLWQVRHDWPTLEFIRNAQRHKIAAQSLGSFVHAQVILMHPLVAPVWIIGLAALAFSPRLRRDRGLALVYLTALAILVLQRSKPYYLSGAYPPLIAAGAVMIEAWTAVARRWVRPVAVGLLIAGGLLLAPFAVPILSMQDFIAYQHALHFEPSSDERSELGPLPQFYADRCGWQEMTAAVAKVCAALPPADRARTIIVGDNYGEAGALLYYGRGLDLPRVVSQHNSFYLWGPGNEAPVVFIIVGADLDDLRQAFESVEPAARIVAPLAMPYETADPICVCRGLKIPLADAWQRGKHYI